MDSMKVALQEYESGDDIDKELHIVLFSLYADVLMVLTLLCSKH